MTKVLLLPFFCDGYDEEVMNMQVAVYRDALESMSFQVTTAEPIKTYAGAKEASETYHPFAFDLVVLLAATWSEPRLASVASRVFWGRPMVVVGINEFRLNDKRTEFSSAPASAALIGSFREMGVPCEFLVGDIEDSDNKAKLYKISRVAECLSALRNTKIGFFGHNFNGITEAGFDLSVLRRKLGTEVYSFDGSQLIRTLENLSEEDPLYIDAKEKVEAKISGLPESYKDKVIRMTAALKSYANEYDLQAIALRCHTEFSVEYGLSLCLPLSILGNELTVACEADMPVLLTEIILHNLSQGKTATYADLRTFTKEGMDVGACGMCPTDLTGDLAQASGENGYFANASDMNMGKVTLARLLKKPDGKLELHNATGYATPIEERLQEFGCPEYPMAHIALDSDMEAFMEKTGANHYAIVYGDVTDELKLFCKYSGVTPV